MENHIIYSFFHVNVFHLAVNLLVLWQIKNRLTPVKAFMVAVAASMLPMYVREPTMGLSGFLFAQFGILWGRTGRWKEAAKKAMPFILFTMLLNNVNILLNEAPLKGDPEDPVALFKEACKNEEENINVLFNTLNDAMKELAEE